MEERSLYTITAFTENQVGLLNQLSIVFTRRCLNIESLSASPSSIEGVHKFTFTCWSNRTMMEKVVQQIEKKIGVIKAFLYTDDELVYQEIALYKVPTVQLLDNKMVEEILRRHNARILEVTREYTVIEKTGHNYETETLFNELKLYGLTQFVRSGRVAVTKSPYEYVTMFLEEEVERERSLKEKSDGREAELPAHS